MEHVQELSKRVMEEVDRFSVAITERAKFYAVLLDENPDAVSQFGLNDIPSIVIFREGYPRIYYGQRTGFHMFSFLQDLLTNDPVKLLAHKQDKKQFLSGDNVKVVGFFSKDKKPESLEIFKQAARHFQGEISFALVHDSKLAKSFKLKSEEELIIVKPGERQLHSQSIFTSRDDMVQWLEENRKPLWAELTFTNLYYVWQGSRVTFVAFVKNIEEHLSKTILSTFKSLAKQYGSQHQISFVIVDTGLYKDFSQGLGLKEEDIPNFAIFDPHKRKEHYFPKEQESINLKNTKRWLENFISGKLESPTEDLYADEDLVVRLNSDTFSSIVYDQEKDVLVEFYAPWCGHCITLAPIYKKTASLFNQLLPSVLLASFDVQTNQVPQKYNVTGLPTLLFFSSKDKDNALQLPGPHDGLTIVDFILNHQTAATAEAIEQFKQIFATLVQQQQSLDEDVSDDQDIEEEDSKEEL